MRRGPQRPHRPGLTAEGTLPRCPCRMPGDCQGPPWCPVLLGMTPQAAPRDSCLLLLVVAHSAMGQSFWAGLLWPERWGRGVTRMGEATAGHCHRGFSSDCAPMVHTWGQSICCHTPSPSCQARPAFLELWACLGWEGAGPRPSWHHHGHAGCPGGLLGGGGQREPGPAGTDRGWRSEE